ncbi:uncharacterized protein PF3D7_0210200-like isoform X1 [Procambarus clarkii]|uniref:uncharacterized protein PF3D7_0210200-like isoform X1 n=1 Tax=Procambarus clarkii TaxID=6728 RepID=UPI003742D969
MNPSVLLSLLVVSATGTPVAPQSSVQDLQSNGQNLLSNNQDLQDLQSLPLNQDLQDLQSWPLNHDLQSNDHVVKSNDHVVKSNDQEVQSNDQDVQSNEQDVQPNDQDVESNEQDIQFNEQDVQSNEQDVQSNEQDVQSNDQNLPTSTQNAKLGIPNLSAIIAALPKLTKSGKFSILGRQCSYSLTSKAGRPRVYTGTVQCTGWFIKGQASIQINLATATDLGKLFLNTARDALQKALKAGLLSG